jgi:exodeoxyribonuclease-1
MTTGSFFWHDYETFGTDPRSDRPSQFAGQRTTLELEPIGESVAFYCKPAADVLPQPVSCLITGITPQLAEREGVIEAEFAARVHEELAQPGTCSVGYNSLRFDEEFTRNLLYRNFYEPYEREWKDGNSRWDLIDLVRMCYALRPHGIEWPTRDHPVRGTRVPSFRLEDLSAANHLAHTRAHDARSDVETTIALARLVRVRQPRLFDFYFGLRRKQRAFELLDHAHREPVLHVSSRYPGERGCTAMILPLAAHPTQGNGVIVYDLSIDPTPLLELDVDEIADRVFVARTDLPDDVARIPLKIVHANKSPALAPLSALHGVDTARIGLDVELCRKHARLLQQAEGLAEKVRRVFDVARDSREPVDAELALYRGFASDADKRLLGEVRRTPPAELGARAFAFADPRYGELLFRYRARNYPQTLSVDEAARWHQFRAQKLTHPLDAGTQSLDEYFAAIEAARAAPGVAAGQLGLLDQLQAWGLHIAADLGVPESLDA